jgi:hypothetical protein
MILFLTFNCWYIDIEYSITVVMKVETYIIASIPASLIGQAVILVIMYLKSYKIAIITFNGIVIMCLMLMSHWLIVVSIDQSQLADTDNIIRWYQMQNVQITNKYCQQMITNQEFLYFNNLIKNYLSTLFHFLFAWWLSGQRKKKWASAEI